MTGRATPHQVDLDEAIAARAGLALVPDWLAARAAKRMGAALRIAADEQRAAGLSLPRHVAVVVPEGCGEAELRRAAGLSLDGAGSRRPMPCPGEHEWDGSYDPGELGEDLYPDDDEEGDGHVDDGTPRNTGSRPVKP